MKPILIVCTKNDGMYPDYLRALLMGSGNFLFLVSEDLWRSATAELPPGVSAVQHSDKARLLRGDELSPSYVLFLLEREFLANHRVGSVFFLNLSHFRWVLARKAVRHFLWNPHGYGFEISQAIAYLDAVLGLGPTFVEGGGGLSRYTGKYEEN
jgi:hypothetical protein